MSLSEAQITELEPLAAELARARANFASAECLFSALVEELGELARELMQPHVSLERVEAEALQVACVAMRIRTEGLMLPTENRVVMLNAEVGEKYARMHMDEYVAERDAKLAFEAALNGVEGQ